CSGGGAALVLTMRKRTESPAVYLNRSVYGHALPLIVNRSTVFRVTTPPGNGPRAHNERTNTRSRAGPDVPRGSTMKAPLSSASIPARVFMSVALTAAQ